MTRESLIAFIIFTLLGVGVVFWLVGAKSVEDKDFQLSGVAEPEEIRVLFVGDIMLSRAVGKEMERRNDYLYPFRLVAEEVERADLAFGNLEGPISARGRNQGSIYSFRADPRSVNGLAFAGFDVVSLANNHTLDWGKLALEDTITILREMGIETVGGGRNKVEANAPVIKEIKSTKIAFLAYTPLYPKALQARGSSSGVSVFDKEKIVSQIQKLGDQVDIIVVSLHWGEEYQTSASAAQRELAGELVDAGADLVIGHHPHVVQEVEKYKNSWIAYSLGNFVFDQLFSEETRTGLVVMAIVKDKQVTRLEERTVYISPTFQPEWRD